MKKYLLLAGVLCAEALWAAPAGKAEPVAEGYPDWQGAVDKNHIAGRYLCASDLRQRGNQHHRLLHRPVPLFTCTTPAAASARRR